MQGLSLLLCRRCRKDIYRSLDDLFPRNHSSTTVLRRIATKSGKPPFVPRRSDQSLKAVPQRVQTHSKTRPSRQSRPSIPSSSPKYLARIIKEKLYTPLDALKLLRDDARWWASHREVLTRFESWGIASVYIAPLLKRFTAEVAKGSIFTSEEEEETGQLQRLSDALSGGSAPKRSTDQILTSAFLSWASKSSSSSPAFNTIPNTVKEALKQLRDASDMSYPAEWYPSARSMRRKIIMHVGPTNSGKTHGALRALAASRRGLYAGPLRLLAHEIWDRLNKGKIVPLGAVPDPSGETSYVRKCNLLTGEEKRIVEEGAGLLSCTVEMVPLVSVVDVAVVDEIQMIADPERGGAWTAAVLGLTASELHLCGEATAVPLIEAMIKDTGDELEVHHYERLTPLTVAEKSLHNNLALVEKGDCVVTFSRSSIFSLKKRIEAITGLRCAVAYGRLPPEIRAEQAALFNDPNNDYDVIIGSDAIGMGLNLKIKRIVFEALTKWNGMDDVQLSLSQVKQIAGRAGRYGMEAVGIATTLRPQDLPILRRALASETPPLRHARVQITQAMQHDIAQALPPDRASLGAIADMLAYGARLRVPYLLQDDITSQDVRRTDYVDAICGKATLIERELFRMAPTAWRDDASVESMTRIMKLYMETGAIGVKEALDGDKLNVLEDVKEAMHSSVAISEDTKQQRKGKDNQQMRRRMPTKSSSAWFSGQLSQLEGLHKMTSVYLWLSYRLPAVFHEQPEAFVLKGETERAIDFCLRLLSSLGGVNIEDDDGKVVSRPSRHPRLDSTAGNVNTNAIGP